MKLDVRSDELASAIFGGFANSRFAKAFLAMINGAVLPFEALSKKIADGIKKGIDLVKKGWNFLKNWFKDDPVRAAAGVAAAALLGLVVISVGGAIIAGLGGGIALLLKGVAALGLIQLGGMAFNVNIIGTAIRWAVRLTSAVYNFNWNVSDKDIVQQQKALIDSLWGQVGETLGTALGTGLCGVLPVAIAKQTKVIKTNPAVLAKLRTISEGNLWGSDRPELYDELMEQVSSLVQFGAQQATTYAFLETYKNARKWIKRGAKFVGLKKMFPRLSKWIEEWGTGDPWSFAIEVENRIESINNANIRNFTEETVEAFMDSCSESLMIVSYAF